MQFDYEITADDSIASHSLYTKLRGHRHFHFAFGAILVGLMLIEVAWRVRFVDRTSIPLATVGVLLIYLAATNLSPARRFRRAYQKGDLAGKRFQAKITEEGFEVTGDLRSWKVRWPGVQFCGENERVFVFYSAGTLFTFAKRYLDEEQQRKLRELSGMNLPRPQAELSPF